MKNDEGSFERSCMDFNEHSESELQNQSELPVEQEAAVEEVGESVRLSYEAPSFTVAEPTERKKRTVPLDVFVCVLCVAVAFSVIFSYVLASSFMRNRYAGAILAQQQELAKYQDVGELALIAAMLEKYSYYADQMSEEEMIDAALRAYVAETGDRYAAYYTKEEYENLKSGSDSYDGIGASTIQGSVNYNGVIYQGFAIDFFYGNSPAQNAGMRRGDFIYAVKVDGVYRSVESLGGYEQALEMIRGEEGTTVQLAVLRLVDEMRYLPIEFTLTRALISNPDVFFDRKDGDPTTALVSIRRFDLETPRLFRSIVDQLRAEGVSHFVFDVRDNPGGDLQSIKAILSFFLKKGDLVLQSIDRNGQVARSYYVEPTAFTDEYKHCSVREEDIGIYSDLDMVVLCNGNTASAAEVFAATMRDYGLAKLVGERTFGKGILQMFFDLSSISPYEGYLKLTTHAYLTKCGETYHEIGIAPDEGLQVALSQEASGYSLYDLPEALDNQLQVAFSQLQK